MERDLPYCHLCGTIRGQRSLADKDATYISSLLEIVRRSIDDRKVILLVS